MNKEILVFGNIEIKRSKFHHWKNLIVLEDVDFDNILISSLVLVRKKKTEINSKDVIYKIKPLHIMLPKNEHYLKSSARKTKCMNYMIISLICRKNKMLFRIKSVKVSGKTSIGNPFIIKTK